MISKEKIILLLLVVLSLFYSVSGVALYFFSQLTFDTMPAYYGTFNSHFVKDAGLAFLSSGVLLGFAILREKQRYIYSFCASIFVVLHGLFHIQMLLGGMVPSEYTAYEFAQVIIPAFALFVLVGVIRGEQKS